jgi:hypothetical protein
MGIRSSIVLSLACVAACGGQIGLYGEDQQRTPVAEQKAPRQPHVHNDSSIDLPNDMQIVEPSQPAVATTQERALVHVHTPTRVCSGVVVAPRVVVTAHQCVDGVGPLAIAPSVEFYVELATSTLTWTKRKVTFAVAPACGWHDLDVVALVLAESVDGVHPLRVMTSPPPGENMQALGFGRCAGETRGLSNRTGQLLRRDSDALVVDVALCRGDVGGPLVDPSSADLYGVISHQDDPDDTAHRTTTIIRLDTTPARALVAQAESLAQMPDSTKLAPVTCE